MCGEACEWRFDWEYDTAQTGYIRLEFKVESDHIDTRYEPAALYTEQVIFLLCTHFTICAPAMVYIRSQ